MLIHTQTQACVHVNWTAFQLFCEISGHQNDEDLRTNSKVYCMWARWHISHCAVWQAGYTRAFSQIQHQWGCCIMYSQHQLQLTNFRDGHFPDNSRHCQPGHPHITWLRQVQHNTGFMPYWDMQPADKNCDDWTAVAMAAEGYTHLTEWLTCKLIPFDGTLSWRGSDPIKHICHICWPDSWLN